MINANEVSALIFRGLSAAVNSLAGFARTATNGDETAEKSRRTRSSRITDGNETQQGRGAGATPIAAIGIAAIVSAPLLVILEADAVEVIVAGKGSGNGEGSESQDGERLDHGNHFDCWIGKCGAD